MSIRGLFGNGTGGSHRFSVTKSHPLLFDGSKCSYFVIG